MSFEEDGQRYQLEYILIEISTDGPGFESDEPYETLGERLSLPPFLEPETVDKEIVIWKL